MSYGFFSRNGRLFPNIEALIPLDDIAYAYGFGVYETLRIHDGIAYFGADHLQRLLHSAQVIDLEHTFSLPFLQQNVQALITQNEAIEANAKLMLIGGRTAADATIYMQLLNPLFPDRKLYRQGAHVITEHYERLYPTAKTLNMLPSYLAYRRAQATGAYDALLINRAGELTEGTRTNFFALQGTMIFSAPEPTILAGVMRKAVLKYAQKHGFTIIERAVPVDTLANYDGAFLTSTSTKIMPLRSIGNHQFATIAEPILTLIEQFADFYNQCEGVLSD